MTASATCAADEIAGTVKVTDTYEYDAFGNEFTVSGGSNTPNEMMYRGEQYDSDLGQVAHSTGLCPIHRSFIAMSGRRILAVHSDSISTIPRFRVAG